MVNHCRSAAQLPYSFVKVSRPILLIALGFAAFCKTGSNYEKLKAPNSPVATPAQPLAPLTGTYVIRPFTFTEVGNRSEMFSKAFVVPGYKGVDYDTYGRMDPSDQKTGMKTIYSLPEAHKLLAAELTKLEVQTLTDTDTPPEKGGVLDVRILGSESSLRMHTYGCWPIVGSLVYLANQDIYTVVTKTKLEYKLSSTGGNPRSETIEVYSEMDFSFWGTYMGFDLYESFEAAQAGHVKDLATRLRTVLPL